MSLEQFSKANELFLKALEQSPEERNAFIKLACAGDEPLREEVESLLTSHRKADNFMKQPAINTSTLKLIDQEEQLVAGELIGSYRIIREIGRGGMGSVYLAERADQQFKKHVAIKLIKRGMDTDYLLQRFRNERQILANFDHPNIARLLDGGSTKSGLPYFVMEYVEGEIIDDYCKDHSLNITQRLEIFQQVCAAVTYAHHHLVVHRDLKPSNILVTKEGAPKLLDFGIAKILQSETGGERAITATEMHAMTPEYASPEQAQGMPVTTASDVYSLGVVLYELLTGCSPYRFASRSPLEVARIITTTNVQLPSAIVHTVEKSPAESSNTTIEGSVDRLRRRLEGDVDNIVLMALRKEPERRYRSVEQFSDDIRRHLQGLPVLARKDTFSYRASKFVKRNKVAVAALAFAIIALVVSAAIAGIIQWRANQQAKFLQEFGQEVTRIEAIMRYAYLLPLHDVQQEKNQVADRLKQVKNKMEALGTQAYGPGHYSLGRGYLALHRYQDAYDHLIQAWEKYEYRETPVANALGLSLALLYQEKLREAEQIYRKDILKERKNDLEKQYYTRAFQYIQQGRSQSEAPEYVEALLMFLKTNYPEALRKTESAGRKISWLYEAKILQGDILAAMGNDRNEVGETAEATDFYNKAIVIYLEAANKGQSDPRVYEGLCTVQSSIQGMLMGHQGTAPETVLQEGISYCEKALQADSKNINANLIASKMYRNQVGSQIMRSEPGIVFAEKSIKYAQTALKIDPKNGMSHRALGNAYSIRAQGELVAPRGNPLPFFDLADASFEKASRKMPEDHELLSIMGLNLMKRATFIARKEQDPKPSLQKAIQVLDKAIEINPREAKYYGMLGNVYYTKGVNEMDIGADPRHSLQHAITFLRKSVEVNPNVLNSHYFFANSYLALAGYQIDRGENPITAADEAIAGFKRCLNLSSGDTGAYHGLGVSYWRKALTLQKQGNDPTAELNYAREAFRNALHGDVKRSRVYSFFAETELVAARYAIRRGKSAETFFKEAERILKSCLKINPDSQDCQETMASRYLLDAEHRFSRGQSVGKIISFGLDAADHSLKSASYVSEVHAIRGKLLLLNARSSSGEARKKAAMEAVSSFDQAFKLKDLLRREYLKDQEEARRLINN